MLNDGAKAPRVRVNMTAFDRFLTMEGRQFAAEAAAATSPGPTPTAPEPKKEEEPEKPPVVTEHEVKVRGKSLKYFVTTGMMPIKNEKGETEAQLFFMAYT